MAKKSDTDKIVDAALRLAAKMPWETISLHHIARSARMKLSLLQDYVTDKDAIVLQIIHRIDQRMKAEVNLADESVREKLFEIIMTRFDLMNQNRAAILSILHAKMKNPVDLLCFAPRLKPSARDILEYAGVSLHGIQGELKTKIFMMALFSCMRVWIDDESKDLSKTMACVDKRLSALETAATSFKNFT